jgi:hypothetical protein
VTESNNNDIVTESNNNNIVTESNNNDIVTESNNNNIVTESNNNNDESISAIEFLNKIKSEREVFNKIIEINQEKTNLQSEINKLKLNKKKIDEKKIKFDCDLELYFKFKNLLDKDNKFILPELFINKFKLFNKLEINNNLCFESFIENYIEEPLQTSYFDLFETHEYVYKLPIPESFNDNNIDELKSVAF